jgi:hypothetical protein
MMRILKFELRVTLPQVYLPRLIPRCLSAEEQSTDEELQQTTLYRQTQAKIVRSYVPQGRSNDSMMSSRLATMYTPRTVAAACLYDTLRELNFRITGFEEWCRDIGKIDDRDVDGNSHHEKSLQSDAIEDLRSLTQEGISRDII